MLHHRVLSEPDEYDGGELIVEDTFGHQSVKLAAGDAIVYPAAACTASTPSPVARAMPRFSGRKA